MKVLVALPRIPYPLEKGDKLRAYYQIKELSKYHDIFLVALYNRHIPEDAMRELAPYCKEIHFIKQNIVRSAFNVVGALFSGIPLQCGLFYCKKNHKKIQKLMLRISPDVIYCQLFRMAEYFKDCRTKKIIDYQDAFGKGMERRAEKAFPLLRPLFKFESERIFRYENEIFDLFDKKTIITDIDRELIRHPMRREIEVVPNGVDFEKFSSAPENKEFDLIFSGNMNYPPNVDAAVFFAKEIFPILKSRTPQLKMVISGANPSTKVRSLQNDDIIVTGWVASMTEYYAKSRVFVAPMRLGTGLQNKLLEAMSMKLPCVTSPLAAAPLKDATKVNAIVSCSTVSQYVEAISRLLTDDEYYSNLSEAGYKFVRDNYSWSEATKPLLELINQ